jgi:hypothetical protein
VAGALAGEARAGAGGGANLRPRGTGRCALFQSGERSDALSGRGPGSGGPRLRAPPVLAWQAALLVTYAASRERGNARVGRSVERLGQEDRPFGERPYAAFSNTWSRREQHDDAGRFFGARGRASD